MSEINWTIVAEHAKSIAAELCKGTDTPLDDMIVGALGGALVDEIRRRFGPPVMEAIPPMMAASEIEEAAADAGVALSPALIVLLQTLGPVLVKLFLERLK